MFLEIQRGISKIERRFRICRRFFEMFRPGYVNALGRKNRPCRPLHKETRRRIIDRYLTGEGPKAIKALSTAARATPGAVYCIIRHHETFSTCEAFSQGGRSYPSKLSDDVVESIELFKLAKLRIYEWENRERLLSSGFWNRRSTGHHLKRNMRVCMELKFD